jgi:endonuclease-3 related protein
MAIYRRLMRDFGPQGWWPGRTSFEIAVGAILTQNTNWANVEKAIGNLRSAGALSPRAMAGLHHRRLASLIRPSGYYNVKTRRLGSFLRYLGERHGLDMRSLLDTPTGPLRRELLEVKGIGPETADSILLYAAGRPVFVVDAYTMRVFSRHLLIDEKISYHDLQDFFHRQLPRDADLFNEYHALIVRLGKSICRPKNPRCGECPLEPRPSAGRLPG